MAKLSKPKMIALFNAMVDHQIAIQRLNSDDDAAKAMSSYAMWSESRDHALLDAFGVTFADCRTAAEVENAKREYLRNK